MLQALQSPAPFPLPVLVHTKALPCSPHPQHHHVLGSCLRATADPEDSSTSPRSLLLAPMGCWLCVLPALPCHDAGSPCPDTLGNSLGSLSSPLTKSTESFAFSPGCIIGLFPHTVYFQVWEPSQNLPDHAGSILISTLMLKYITEHPVKYITEQASPMDSQGVSPFGSLSLSSLWCSPPRHGAWHDLRSGSGHPSGPPGRPSLTCCISLRAGGISHNRL